MVNGSGRGGCKGLARALLAVAIASCPVSARAAGSTATANGIAQATVVVPIMATQLADLDFGMVASNPARGGTVALQAGSDRASYSGGVRNGCNDQSCPAAHSARFAVAGEPNRSYAVSFPASVTISGQAANGRAVPVLTVTGIAVRTASRPNAGAHGQLGAIGTDQFGLGGTLQVPAGLTPAHYRVQVAVVVDYS